MPDSPPVALVTGGTGFVGKHLVRALLERGQPVHVLVRTRASPMSGATAHPYDGTMESVFAALQAARPEVVYHLAACFRSEHTEKDLIDLVHGNLLLGLQLLDAMAEHHCRLLVNTGSSWQHYQDQDYCPVNLYAATKEAFEDLLRFFVEARGLRAITLKLFDTYGPEDFRPKLLNKLREAAQTQQPLSLSPGEQLIDLVHVDDVVRAYVLAADRLRTGQVNGHESYAVSSGRQVRLRDLVALAEQALRIPVPVAWGARDYRQREVMRPWTRGIPLPGWQPRVVLEEGLRQAFSISPQAQTTPNSQR